MGRSVQGSVQPVRSHKPEGRGGGSVAYATGLRRDGRIYALRVPSAPLNRSVHQCILAPGNDTQMQVQGVGGQGHVARDQTQGD